ncbi:MAG: cation:proton antiporter [Candidatus Altiarchaeia archaeon]
MKEKIKRVQHKARSYARYVLVGLVVLLFLSVFRASIFDQYLFRLDGVADDSTHPEAFMARLESLNHSLAESVKGAIYVNVPGEKAVSVIKGGEDIAELEVIDGTLYLITDGHRTSIGVARVENGAVNIYASLTPESEKIWFEISFILLVAISAELLVVYIKQPAVMVLLVLGILISPSVISAAYPPIASIVSSLFSAFGINIPLKDYVPHLVPTEEGSFVSIFAKLGSIFLLFGVGLHSEISKIFNRRNFLVAFAGVILPFIGGYAYATMGGHNFAYSMFLGAALTATSVGVTVAVLQEFRVLDREFSKIVLGAAVIDDILSLLVLSLVKNLPSNPSGLDAATLYPFFGVLATAFVYVMGGIMMGQYLVKRLFDGEENGGELSKTTFLGVLVYLLSYSYVAEIIGLSAIVGAFLAGVTLNYSRIIHKVVKLFYPLEALFTPIFFVSLGMYVDIQALFTNLEPIIVITLIAVATKILACGFATKATGGNFKDSLIVGIGMVPRGEVALIIGFYGLTTMTSSGEPILTAAEYAVIASMSFLTTIIIPPLLQGALR